MHLYEFTCPFNCLLARLVTILLHTREENSGGIDNETHAVYIHKMFVCVKEREDICTNNIS